MAELVADCPRCGANHITFDIEQAIIIGQRHGWQNWYEVFSVCRNCKHATIFVLSELVYSSYERVHKVGLVNIPESLNNYVNVEDYVSLKNAKTIEPPKHLPGDIESAFIEGATCFSVGCNNAAAAMFRLCIDLATKSLLPLEEVESLSSRMRRDLGLRLPWLFDNQRLDSSLRDLSSCIKEGGNDGVHDGNLCRDDAEDLLEFTYILLERIFSESEKIKLAKERRTSRRAEK